MVDWSSFLKGSNIHKYICGLNVTTFDSLINSLFPWKQGIIKYSDLKWMRQKFYLFFINEKFKKILYFFTCILPNYVPHEITKEFWKNSHFWNVTAGFLLGCQNSLQWNTPEKIHFQECLFFIFTNIAHLIVIALTKCSLCWI